MRRIPFGLITALYFFFLLAGAKGEETLQGRIVYEGPEPLVVRPGTAFAASIEIWPLSGIGTLGARDWEGQTLFHLFYVAKVNSISISQNNQDVLQIRVLLVLLRNFSDTHLHLLEIRDKKIPVFLSQIKPDEGEALDPKAFLMIQGDFEEQKGSKVPFKIWGVLILALILGKGILHIGKKMRKKARRRKGLEEWEKKFSMARGREDYEQIYQAREEWEKFRIGGAVLPGVADFFRILRAYQYKKEWTQEELFEVSRVFQKAREEFLGKGTQIENGI